MVPIFFCCVGRYGRKLWYCCESGPRRTRVRFAKRKKARQRGRRSAQIAWGGVLPMLLFAKLAPEAVTRRRWVCGGRVQLRNFDAMSLARRIQRSIARTWLENSRTGEVHSSRVRTFLRYVLGLLICAVRPLWNCAARRWPRKSIRPRRIHPVWKTRWGRAMKRRRTDRRYCRRRPKFAAPVRERGKWLWRRMAVSVSAARRI